MNILSSKISGIYEIRNTINGHRYIGSSVNISKRLEKHLWELSKSRHHSEHLQRAWSKYGKDCFSITVLEQCDSALLIQREQFYIDILHPEYNIAPNAGTSLGRVISEKTKRLMSEAMKGRPSLLKGRTLPQETKDKISATLKGRVFSDVWRQRISESLFGEKRAAGKRSNEIRQKMRVAHLGKKLSEEHKANISKALKGRKKRPHSEETKAKLRVYSTGRPQSNATKLKRSESMKQAWKRKRGT